MRVAFLGPEGTFTEEALLASSDSDSVEPVAEPTIYDCVLAVQEGGCDRALVPIENSLEGSVNPTLDALVFETDSVHIVGETVHPVRHCLIARRKLPLGQITRIVSHPQATAQCARFLREQLGDVDVVSANSTADAVRIVATEDGKWAALGNRLSATLYDCVVLRDGVEDRSGNETRFVWLAREQAGAVGEYPPEEGPWKTSIVFWGLPDSPGALVGALSEFATRGVNLSRIESRPRREGLGRYIFFADLEAAASDERVLEALDAVRSAAETLRILGCYRAFAV